MDNRLDWVDYAKGLGIILVVYGHVARGLVNADIDVPSFVAVADSVIYSFHMPLFFFLSGIFFIQSINNRGASGVVVNKIDTILYPYIAWSLLQGGFEVALSNYTNGAVTLSDVLSLWDPRAQFWFLYILFFVFCFFCFLFNIIPVKYTLAVFVISCLCSFFIAEFSDVRVVLLFAEHAVFFLFGMIFSKYKLASYLVSKRSFVFLTVLFFAFQTYVQFVFGVNHVGVNVYFIALSLVSIFFIVSLSLLLSRMSVRIILNIGSASMAIYLMHILVGSGSRVVLNKIFTVNDFFVHLVVGCVAGVFIPLYFSKTIDKLKIPFIFSAPISNVFKKKSDS